MRRQDANITTTVPSGRSVRRSLGDRGPQQVATQVFEPPTILTRRGDARMRVEPVAPPLERPRRVNPGRVGIVAETLDARAGARSEREPALHGGVREPGERDRLGGQGVGSVGVHGQTAASQQSADALSRPTRCVFPMLRSVKGAPLAVG
jgi:hypothetical protein